MIRSLRHSMDLLWRLPHLKRTRRGHDFIMEASVEIVIFVICACAYALVMNLLHKKFHRICYESHHSYIYQIVELGLDA